ncbi:MAG: Cell division protein FtsZ [Crocinitomicaceae bacterium]|nr:MAG: Cell division protein FtsZ [Crocinitomicaceae bacterium]
MMKFDLPKEQSSIIKVIGVGGGGSNAVNHMYRQGIKGVDFVVCNTDHQALDTSPVPTKIPLGQSLTEGRGAGSIPDVGKNAAIENLEDVNEILAKNTKMIFVTAGMGGGTGTGAAPVIAQAAKDMGILTVGIITVPFTFEGRKRRTQAEEGIEKMRESVDTLLVINNDKLREMFGNLTLVNAFENADDVLAIAAKGIAEVISVTGQINVDFNDVNTVMKDSGVAIMGSAEAEGENRAIKCVENALNSPLLNDNNIDGAKYVLLNITYGTQAVLMDEISDITDYIQEEAGSTADVIWGHGYDESLGDKLCVTIIATGFNTTPHTGLSMKAPKKNIMNLEDDSPEIITNQSEQLTEPVTNTVEESFEETPELNPSESAMKRYVLEEDDEISEENEITNDAEESDNSNLYEQNTQQNDGKVRFLLEDDEMPNLDTDLKQSENTQILEADLMTANDEEKIVDQVKQVESKAISDERLERIKKATDKLRSPLGLNEMESEPAYKRRNVDLKDVKYSDDSSSSRYTLWENINDSGEKETGLSDNNSFLHDNVD